MRDGMRVEKSNDINIVNIIVIIRRCYLGTPFAQWEGRLGKSMHLRGRLVLLDKVRTFIYNFLILGGG